MEVQDEEEAAELTQEAASLIEKAADVADETAAALEKPVSHLVRSEKLKNKSALKFQRFRPEFAPNFAAPNFLRFLGNGRH